MHGARFPALVTFQLHYAALVIGGGRGDELTTRKVKKWKWEQLEYQNPLTHHQGRIFLFTIGADTEYAERAAATGVLTKIVAFMGMNKKIKIGAIFQNLKGAVLHL